MEVQVQGERIDPKDLTEDAGWRIAKYRRTPANKTVNPKNEGGSALPGGSLASDPRGKPKGAKQRIIRAGKMPHLPTDDTKVVIRPKGGLNISKIGGPAIAAAIFQATGIPEERAADTICPNVQQNIIVVSTPSASNLHKYLRMKGFHVGGHMYEVNSYEAAPSLTTKGDRNRVPDRPVSEPVVGADTENRPPATKKRAMQSQTENKAAQARSEIKDTLIEIQKAIASVHVAINELTVRVAGIEEWKAGVTPMLSQHLHVAPQPYAEAIVGGLTQGTPNPVLSHLHTHHGQQQ
ncbi:hypothetical protein HPB50_004239 [Hyalomma asiaticum]|uniref:Uncharacterized protein n=1 Tax=Hyalomma asiaticum TaxID=266040 RepID=A0ACB7RWV4_HYAAI|nr:hypothetical protein HPB50_004239 [Hyalomma asiaticum]